MTESVIAMLSLGFGLGLLHALDADHVMAVSSLANRQNNTGKTNKRHLQTLAFCARWALGHGGILCLLAAALLFFDLQLPAWAHVAAEKLVGVILIAIAAWIFWQFYRYKIQLQVHDHEGHTHIHLVKEHNTTHTDHSPTLIGITHGLAGSAPVLALLPTLNAGSSVTGIAYALLFSLGVLCTMALFGLAYGHIQTWLAHRSEKLFDATRLVVASLAAALGVFWLMG